MRGSSDGAAEDHDRALELATRLGVGPDGRLGREIARLGRAIRDRA